MLLVAGNLVYDWIAGPVEELAWDRTTWPGTFAAGLGGNGGTTAYAAARLGTRVRLVSACGADLHGAICKERLASVGVEGAITCRPGKWANTDSMLCECWEETRGPAPLGPRLWCL